MRTWITVLCIAVAGACSPGGGAGTPTSVAAGPAEGDVEATYDFPSVSNFNAITADADSIYLAATNKVTEGNWEWRVLKVDPANGGVLWQKSPSMSEKKDECLAIAHWGEFLFCGGTEWVSIGGKARCRVEQRLKSSGSLVRSYVWDPTAEDDIVTSVVCDGSSLYAFGYGNGKIFGVKWALSTGDPVWTIIRDALYASEQALAAVDSTFSFILVGEAKDSSLIQKWDSTAGGLVSSFGIEGQIRQSGTEERRYFKDVAADLDSAYIAGCIVNKSNDSHQLVIEKRASGLGTPVKENGWANHNPRLIDLGTGEAGATAVVRVGLNLFVVAYDSSRGLLLQKMSTQGDLGDGFGTAGMRAYSNFVVPADAAHWDGHLFVALKGQQILKIKL